ncbi:polysaccharide deacetylase family protein [Alteromonas ponticola]|uniref:Polysaccharide deacetylase family protein n=1 Tax=Alteromonas ponticola TaxID=2720613 RepID=A0ABX1R0R7_9ALTE|nr:polysaccharide deacetylase family protein [Alteromonas ponticola]NMH59046.1 polysaccharide deacetylase family protein [Alteromonas ponticola]
MKKLIKKCLQSLAGTVGWQLAKAGDKKLIILMYHRVLPANDPRYRFEEPGMVVTDSTFKMHMEVLANERIPVLTVDDWVNSDDKDKPQLAIAITFDDGWLDNFEYAFPVLKEYKFVSTLYVVTDYLAQPAPFWPNKVLRLLLDENSKPDETWSDLLNLLNHQPNVPLSRDEAAACIKTLKQHSDQTIYAALNNISSSGMHQVEMMSQSQISQAQQEYGVTVGCHTRKHMRLIEGLPQSVLSAEIVESKSILSEISNEHAHSFCFPNGDYSDSALALVRQHYANAVTTKRGHNRVGCDVHQLVRIGVHNDISNTPLKFKARLSSYI